MKLFLVYWEGGGWGISLKECRIYYNRNGANSYRWRKQKEIGDKGKMKIKIVYSHGRGT